RPRPHTRRLARTKTRVPKKDFFFRRGSRPPYHWEGILAFLAPRAIPGVEIVDAGSYRRNISLSRESGLFEVSLHKSGLALSVRIQFGDSRALFVIIERIRRMFDLS